MVLVMYGTFFGIHCSDMDDFSLKGHNISHTPMYLSCLRPQQYSATCVHLALSPIALLEQFRFQVNLQFGVKVHEKIYGIFSAPFTEIRLEIDITRNDHDYRCICVARRCSSRKDCSS